MFELMGGSEKYSHDRGVPPLLAEQPLLGPIVRSESAADERVGNNLNDLSIRTENGSNQGLHMALTGLCVPSSLDSGRQEQTWGSTGVPH